VSSLIVRATTRVLTPGILVLSLVLLVRGHDEPGGGFIGGLVAGAAVVLEYLAGGPERLRRFPPVRGTILLATGIGLAVAYGLAGLAFGDAFLEGAVWKAEVPVAGELKVAASLAFDAGVYLVVLALVVAYVRVLGEEPG
jgi:multicomponent Na+:H+ antiporter subunit A